MGSRSGRSWTYGPRALASVTLAALLAVAALGLIVARAVEDRIRDEQHAEARHSAELLSRSSLFPPLMRGGARLTRAELRDVDRRLAAARELTPGLAVTVWDRRLSVVYTSGRAVPGPLPKRAARAALLGRPSTLVTGAAERERLAAVLPVSAPGRAQPLAAVAVTEPYAPRAATIRRRTRSAQALVLGAALLFYVLLLPQAVRTFRALRRAPEVSRRAFDKDLRRAIDHGEIELHFQPIAAARTRAVEVVEALVRRRRPGGELVPPGDFIPQAEQTGAIWPLTLHICELALRQSRAWLRGGSEIPVAVNLSTVTLLDERLPAELSRLLAAYGVPPPLFHLEITESAIMSEPDRALSVLARLAELGIGVIAIDDFGTGYSSLARLHELPLDALKIDRSFVARMASDGDQVLVSSIVDLAHDLGLNVIAEGVEDEPTWDALAALGCESAQGYWLCRPLPATELTRWLARHPASLPKLRSALDHEAGRRKEHDRQLRWAAFTERHRRGREP